MFAWFSSNATGLGVLVDRRRILSESGASAGTIDYSSAPQRFMVVYRHVRQFSYGLFCYWIRDLSII